MGDVITCPCPWCLLRVQHSSMQNNALHYWKDKSNILAGLCVIIFIPSNNYIAHSKNSFCTLRIWEANIKTLNLNSYLWNFGDTGLCCLHLNENLLKWLIWYPYVIHPIPGLIGPVVSDIYIYIYIYMFHGKSRIKTTYLLFLEIQCYSRRHIITRTQI